MVPEAEWLARRRAFDADEEVPTPPVTAGLGLLGPSLERSRSFSRLSVTSSEGAAIRRRRRPEVRSWLTSIDGVVNGAIGSAARFLSEADGDEVSELPVSEHQTHRSREVLEAKV